jgi:hypothetical protein
MTPTAARINASTITSLDRLPPVSPSRSSLVSHAAATGRTPATTVTATCARVLAGPARHASPPAFHRCATMVRAGSLSAPRPGV